MFQCSFCILQSADDLKA